MGFELVGLLLIIGVVWIAVPRIPFKRISAIFLFAAFPVAALILLTGGHFDVSIGSVLSVVAVGALVTGLVAAATALAR